MAIGRPAIWAAATGVAFALLFPLHAAATAADPLSLPVDDERTAATAAVVATVPAGALPVPTVTDAAGAALESAAAPLRQVDDPLPVDAVPPVLDTVPSTVPAPEVPPAVGGPVTVPAPPATVPALRVTNPAPSPGPAAPVPQAPAIAPVAPPAAPRPPSPAAPGGSTPVDEAEPGSLPPLTRANLGRAALDSTRSFAFPFALAVLVGAFLLLQHRVGSSDPKLAAAPLHDDMRGFR